MHVPITRECFDWLIKINILFFCAPASSLSFSQRDCLCLYLLACLHAFMMQVRARLHPYGVQKPESHPTIVFQFKFPKNHLDGLFLLPPPPSLCLSACLCLCPSLSFLNFLTFWDRVTVSHKYLMFPCYGKVPVWCPDFRNLSGYASWHWDLNLSQHGQVFTQALVIKISYPCVHKYLIH